MGVWKTTREPFWNWKIGFRQKKHAANTLRDCAGRKTSFVHVAKTVEAGSNARADDLQCMPVSGLGDSRHDLSGHTQAVEDVVSGNLVRHQSKERFQCYERAADLGLGELLDCLDLAAQTS